MFLRTDQRRNPRRIRRKVAEIPTVQKFPEGHNVRIVGQIAECGEHQSAFIGKTNIFGGSQSGVQHLAFAVFDEKEQTKCKVIYEIMPDVLLAEAERQLNRSSNDISHVGFTETWAKEHGKIVYQD
jgi:argininosuccinate synthase